MTPEEIGQKVVDQVCDIFKVKIASNFHLDFRNLKSSVVDMVQQAIDESHIPRTKRICNRCKKPIG